MDCDITNDTIKKFKNELKLIMKRSPLDEEEKEEEERMNVN